MVIAQRGFLGLTDFYHKFARNYAFIAHPLTNLLKKNIFKWSPEAQLAFESLKTTMVSAPVLVLRNFSEPFIFQTDTSGYVVGVVLPV